MRLKFSWQCPFCQFIGETRRKLEKHKKDEHKSEQQKFLFAPGGICQYCRCEYKRKCDLTVHEKRCFKNPDRIEYKKHLQTEETKNKIRKTNSIKHTMGGYREGSGRGKKGRYKGYYCDSSWELAFVIYNLEHNISFERNKQQFSYTFNGEQHNYIPDWKIENDFVEIKGYWTEQWQAKLDQFPKEENLRVITKVEMKPYLEYVRNKYGRNFINLYE